MWNEVPALLEKRKAEEAAALEAWWNENAPAGERPDPQKAIVLLLHKVKEYETALLRIAGKAEEQKALMDHRERTGQEVTESDRQRWFAWLKTAHIAAEVLARPALVTALKDLEGQATLNPAAALRQAFPFAVRFRRGALRPSCCARDMKARRRERGPCRTERWFRRGGGLRSHFAPALQGIVEILGLVFGVRRAVAEIHAVVSGRLLQHKAEGPQFFTGNLKRCGVHGLLLAG